MACEYQSLVLAPESAIRLFRNVQAPLVLGVVLFPPTGAMEEIGKGILRNHRAMFFLLVLSRK